MLTLDALRTKISSIEDLQAVVRTMKSLAMVSIRQYEQARTSLSAYNHTVELGLQALLYHRRFADPPQGLMSLASPEPKSGWVGVVLFGSDHGLCGPFNEHIVTYALDQLGHRHIQPDRRRLAAVGARLIPYLGVANQPVQTSFSLPSSLAGTPHLLQDLLQTIEQWRLHQNVTQILLFYNQLQSTTTYQPSVLSLFPIDRDWLNDLEQRPWSSPALPTLNQDWESLLSALIRQHLFVSLYRATVESLASENAGRLMSMQAAEKNIEERLADLQADYRRQRQNSITGELLDIVSGFEALKNQDP
ncbi:MAG: F0F1 ATP synthase subunit gamma [Leptolyngbya sp. LCM1.Bin17]|nr:MAG: F0F1 ATP synthase subunit gamma [Leptolyngbya sp. LCM1.Bin17]